MKQCFVVFFAMFFTFALSASNSFQPHHAISFGGTNFLLLMGSKNETYPGKEDESIDSSFSFNVNYAYIFNPFFRLKTGLTSGLYKNEQKKKAKTEYTTISRHHIFEIGPVFSYSFVKGDTQELYSTFFGVAVGLGRTKYKDVNQRENEASSERVYRSRIRHLSFELGQRIPLFSFGENVQLFYTPSVSVIKTREVQIEDSVKRNSTESIFKLLQLELNF